jgi:hypothetical protein
MISGDNIKILNQEISSMSKNPEGKVQFLLDQLQPNSNDLITYRHILRETMNQHLIACLQQCEDYLLDYVKGNHSSGIRSLTVLFKHEHIYQSILAIDRDIAIVSLEHCINDYIYEDKLLGLYKKQMKFTDIDIKVLFQRIHSTVDVDTLLIVKEILTEDSHIVESVEAYFENLGFHVEELDNDYTLVLKLSW